MEANTRLEMCVDLLVEYGSALKALLKAGGQTREPPAIALQRAFGFGQATIEAMRLLLPTDKYASLMQTLCRPYFELTALLLWAARTTDGWQRLQTLWVDANKKWAQEAVNLPPIAEHAKAILKGAEEVLDRKDASGNPYDPAPPINQVLKTIEEQNVAEGLAESGRQSAKFQYTVVYRMLCRPAHGHIQALNLLPDAVRRHAATSAVVATWMLLQAFCHVQPAERDKCLETAGERVKEILRPSGERTEASSAPEPRGETARD